MVGRSLTDLLARGIDNRSRARKITPERELNVPPAAPAIQKRVVVDWTRGVTVLICGSAAGRFASSDHNRAC